MIVRASRKLKGFSAMVGFVFFSLMVVSCGPQLPTTTGELVTAISTLPKQRFTEVYDCPVGAVNSGSINILSGLKWGDYLRTWQALERLGYIHISEETQAGFFGAFRGVEIQKTALSSQLVESSTQNGKYLGIRIGDYKILRFLSSQNNEEKTHGKTTFVYMLVPNFDTEFELCSAALYLNHHSLTQPDSDLDFMTPLLGTAELSIKDGKLMVDSLEFGTQKFEEDLSDAELGVSKADRDSFDRVMFVYGEGGMMFADNPQPALGSEATSATEAEAGRVLGKVTNLDGPKDVLNVRKAPSRTDEIVARLSSEAQLEVLGKKQVGTEIWYQVRTSEGLEGYCLNNYVAVENPDGVPELAE